LWTLVAIFLASIPLPIFKKEWHCFECGNTFRKTSEQAQ